MEHRYSDEDVARVIHAANGELQAILNDGTPSVPWDSEQEGTREIAINGVRLARLGASNRDLHEHWYDAKKAQGWTFGSVKDYELKTHPDLVHWEYLKQVQRDKVQVFSHIVMALTIGD
jgi:hypothetical protein